jgi:8-oxo-dGTP pyrophosphatase MutT (NUDIX family)
MLNSMTAETETPPIPAASLLLVRNGRVGLETLMLERCAGMTFAPGALVFPGGRVDPADNDPGWRDLCADPDADDLAYRIAAIRESYEECGILPARPRAAAQRAIRHRRAVLDGTMSFRDMVAGEGASLDTDRLVPFARWITPAIRPRRFDTRFFLVEAPAGQHAVHDGGEAVSSVWLCPRTAVEDADRGRYRLIFATRLNLLRLSRAAGVEAAFDQARRQPVVTIVPVSVDTPLGPVLRIPVAVGYDCTEMPLASALLG